MYLSSDDMFNRMGICCCRSYGGSPLMVYLVNMFVQESVVKKTVTIVEPDIMADDAHKNIEKCLG